jgi:hypothetical protein
MAKMALGEFYQTFSFTGGGLQSSIHSSQTEFGRYLTAMGLATPDGHRLRPRPENVNRIAATLNGWGADRWIATRAATLKYRFRPEYLRFVLDESETDLDMETYYAGFEALSSEPQLEREFSVVGRGDLERRGARESGLGRPTPDVYDLLGTRLAPPVPQTELDQAVTALGYTDGLSVYHRR